MLFGLFLEQVGTDSAQGALVVFRQLFALVDITANGADKFLHNEFLQLLFLTVSAQTAEGQLAAIHMAAGTLLHLCVQNVGYFNLMQVDDRVTPAADKVYMGICIGIEPFHTTNRGYAGGHSLILKVGQVSVDRSQGDVRMLRLKHLVNHFSGRVGVGITQAGVNGVALSESLSCRLHRHLSFSCICECFLFTS